MSDVVGSCCAAGIVYRIAVFLDAEEDEVGLVDGGEVILAGEDVDVVAHHRTEFAALEVDDREVNGFEISAQLHVFHFFYRNGEKR